MTRFRAIVIDDEPLARNNLGAILARDPEVEIVGVCDGGAQALDDVRRLKPDIVFLDVEMPECDGFDVVELLGADVPPAVVFVTAYDAYALRAFEAGALDYLLKPFDDRRFERALARAKQRVAERGIPSVAARTLVVKSAGAATIVNVDDIAWIEAADYYSRLHVRSGTHLLRRSLSDLAGVLDATTFVRIHRSTIVRAALIHALEPTASGEYDVVLRDGTRLPLSRRYRARLQSHLARGARRPG